MLCSNDFYFFIGLIPSSWTSRDENAFYWSFFDYSLQNILYVTIFFIPQFYSLHLVGRRKENTLFVIFNFIKGISSSCYIVKLFK